MNALNKRVSGIAGLLILQLAVFASARQLSGTAPVVAPPAATNGRITVDESAGGGALISNENSPNKVITQPVEAGGKGDPAFGGERHPLYRLSKSDTVDLSFIFSPDFNQTLIIQPDGFVSLKGAGSLLLEGLTIPQIQLAVANAYRGFLHNPEVTVQLKEFDKPYFLASGEVARPGKYELRGDMTISEAVAVAGGFTQQALHSQVVLFRRVTPELSESHVIDVKKMLNSRNLQEDLHLRPGDFIFVPQSHISKIRKFVPTNAMSWYMNPLQF
jgi:Periplasmic protein involved in polysaccharide export